LLQFKKYRPSGNLKFNNVGIFQGVKFRILMEKILPISLKLNFTQNILGCYEQILKSRETFSPSCTSAVTSAVTAELECGLSEAFFVGMFYSHVYF